MDSKQETSREVKEMNAKLPFSAAGSRRGEETQELSTKNDVKMGIKPGVSNRSKDLSKETETLYKKILRSSNKNFQ